MIVLLKRVMVERFELKSRQQFHDLIATRKRWNQLQGQLKSGLPYEELVGPYWGRHNCALDEVEPGSDWHNSALDSKKERELQCHVHASQWFLARASQETALHSSDLLQLHAILTENLQPQAGYYRVSKDDSMVEVENPADWQLIPDFVESALEWFHADSFGEMHEVERAALMLIRLVDIHPFDRENGKTIRLFSNYFLLKAGYPPAIIRAEQAVVYAEALQEALQLRTGALVKLLTEAVMESLRLCLGEDRGSPRLVILD